MQGDEVRYIATLGLAAGVLLAGLLIQRSLAVFAEARQVWRGYYTLLIREDPGAAGGAAAAAHAAAQAAQLLRAAGFGAVVSAETARERVTTFGGYQWVAIAELAARLDQLDPRYDPYLRGAADWFAAETGAGAARIVYVASSLPPGYFAARLGWALRGGGFGWRIADLPWPRVALAVLLFAAGAALQIGRRDPCSPRWWRLLLALPWAPIVVHGALPAALAALPAYLVCAWLAGPVMGAARQPWRGRWRPALAALAVLLGVVILGLAAPDRPAGGGGSSFALLPARDLRSMAVYLLAGSVWSAALICAGLTVRWLAAAGARRRPALHRPALRRPALRGRDARRWSPRRRGGRRCGGFGASVVGLIGLAMVLAGGRGELIPRPVPAAAGAGFRLAELPALGAGGAGGLPAFSHYAAHAAYQETLQFGRPFALPAPGERVLVDQYRRGQDARVRHAAVEVARFSDRWLQAVLAAAPRASLPALFVAQGRPVAARHGAPAAPAPAAAAAWLLLTLLAAGSLLGRRRGP